MNRTRDNELAINVNQMHLRALIDVDYVGLQELQSSSAISSSLLMIAGVPMLQSAEPVQTARSAT